MKPNTLINDQVQTKQKKAVNDLLDAVEGMPGHHKAAMLARIMTDVVAGTISAAEANELRKAVKI